MILSDVMDALAAAVDTIDGLRVFGYYADGVTPPAAVIAWPDSYDFDSTMGRGSDTCVVPVTVVVGKANTRAARDQLARHTDGAGPGSVKAAVEGFATTSWSSARVQSVAFGTVTIAASVYLAATFDIEIIGKGSS